jgi:hypothetical protein
MGMRIIVLTVVVGFSLAFKSYCQSVAELDKKNGFREFTIGSPLSSVQKELQFNKVLNKTESKLFQVKENVVVNDLVGQTELIFYQDRLVEITIFFNQTTMVDFNQFKESFEKQYGAGIDESNSKNKPDHLTDFDKIIVWKGSMIGLQLNYDVSHKVTELIYWGLSEVTDNAIEEFH